LACTSPVRAACPCQTLLSVCSEVAAEGTLVFIGRVESITPRFLSPWSASRRSDLDRLNQSYEHYLANPSPQALGEWKDTVRRVLPDLPEQTSQRLAAAGSHSALLKLFDEVLSTGTLVRFRVEEVYKAHGDDDDDDDNDDDGRLAAKKQFDVWTPFGECGFAFQPGERYLVYAVSDEGTDHVETNRCTRTKRLSDAGADLAFLYFYKHHAKAAGHLEGIATYDPLLHIEFGASLDTVKTRSPAPGTVIRVQSGEQDRYATAAADGSFLLDGLAVGDYEISAYAPGFPDRIHEVAAPRKFHMKERGCATRIVLLPTGKP
jgi:hypothetical protein